VAREPTPELTRREIGGRHERNCLVWQEISRAWARGPEFDGSVGGMSAPQHHERLARARRSLEGLSTGDAFGERFFVDPVIIETRLRSRSVERPGPWRWTDDTAMALAVVDVLAEHAAVEESALARAWLDRWRREPWRGYGAGMHRLFEALAEGADWREVARSLFEGGSFGNGAAMRVAPLGAYFADDLDAVVEAARRSAIVTHAHDEGQAGAIAIAVAAAAAWQTRGLPESEAREQLFDEVLDRTPDGETRDGIDKARNTSLSFRVDTAVGRLGNGSRISSQDTVPFCLWCIARHLRDYEAALWTTVAGLGDRDTTCAIVGGVVALATEELAIPTEWAERREPLAGLPLGDEAPVGN
jgi:ADP-ribosylglycohydrolase